MKANDVDMFFELLKDGKWHNMDELVGKTKMKERNARLVTSFLASFKFIQLDKKRNRARLDALTRKFLEKLEKVELASRYEEITA
jgi:hypothetical protein